MHLRTSADEPASRLTSKRVADSALRTVRKRASLWHMTETTFADSFSLDKWQVATLLGVNERRATTRTLRRELPWRREHKRLVVPLGAVLAYIEERRKSLADNA